jgi:vacuolar-type H+-ATPase subunit F/Vma7
MSRIAALGESHRVEGFSLAGAAVFAAQSADEVRRAWANLPAEVAVVILTPAAADALGDVDDLRPLRVVLPA